jgi:hypothetical protein
MGEAPGKLRWWDHTGEVGTQEGGGSLAAALNDGGDAPTLVNTWLQAVQHRGKGRSEFCGKKWKKKQHGWSSLRGGGCSGISAKSGEAGDAPAADGGWDIEGRVETGIGTCLGG